MFDASWTGITARLITKHPVSNIRYNCPCPKIRNNPRMMGSGGPFKWREIGLISWIVNFMSQGALSCHIVLAECCYFVMSGFSYYGFSFIWLWTLWSRSFNCSRWDSGWSYCSYVFISGCSAVRSSLELALGTSRSERKPLDQLFRYWII